MLKQALSRPLGCLSHTSPLTKNGHRCVLGFPALIRAFRTSPVAPDEKRVDADNRSKDDPPKSALDAPSPSEDPNPPVQTRGSATATPFDLKALQGRFKELSLQGATKVRQRTDEFTVNTAKTFSELGAHLNKITGYEEIEKLKNGVLEQETKLAATRKAAHEAKKAYDEAVLERSSFQRELNDLLQRKSTWTDEQLRRYTDLVLKEHRIEREEAVSKTDASEAEHAVDREFDNLIRIIWARYHEEQVWSDKIRSASTYGTMAAIALNILVFIAATIFIEPWKRRRLAKLFEKKIEELSAQNEAAMEAGMKSITAQLDAQEKHLHDMVEMALSKAVEVPSAPTDTSNRGSKSAKDFLDQSVLRIVEAIDNREVAVAFGVCAVAAGAVGWFARVLTR